MQVSVAKEDVHKTAVKTPWGLFEYLKMPFGLRNAPPTFQRFVDTVIQNLDNVFAYIDDLIVFSETVEEHRAHLFNLMERLQEYGLVVNVQKTYLFQTKVVYLGVEFGAEGYRPVEAVLPKIDDYQVPKDRKGVQKFLGLLNYYRTHSPNFAGIASPLYDLTHKTVKYCWEERHQVAFEELKQLFKKRLVLTPLQTKGTFKLYTDASQIACGAVLSRMISR